MEQQIASRRTLFRLVGAASLFLVAMAAFSGCNNDSAITVYRIPKEAESPTPPQQQAAAAGATNVPLPAPLAPGEKATLRYDVPPGWQEQPLSAMRAASFKVAGADGKDADVSVVFLTGQAGGDLANVNRWRDQLKLGPIDEPALAEASDHVKAHGHDFLVVDLVSAVPIGQPPVQTRIIGAMLNENDRSWFVKMTGENALVAAQKNAFTGFLASLTIP